MPQSSARAKAKPPPHRRNIQRAPADTDGVHRSAGMGMSPGAAIRAFTKGASSAWVADRRSAEAVAWHLFQSGYEHVGGLPQQFVRRFRPSGVAQTYHWDDEWTPAGVLRHHRPDDPHGRLPHLQVHRPDGAKFRLFFGGGPPGSGR